MKNILNYFACLVLLVITSCSDDFLELSPESYLNASSFYQTEEHFEMAVTGAYESLRPIVNDRSRWLLGEQRSDNATYEYYPANRGYASALTIERIADFIDQNDNRHTNNYYFNCYAGISRTNAIIDRVGDASFDESSRNYFEGQARFLRALFYFDLVRFYGGVPLYLSEVATPDDAFLPRSTVDEVYTQIIEDLTIAVDYLPAPSFPQDGRATSGAARTMLAEVLMTKPTRDYLGAEQQLKEVLKMGYDLLGSYAEAFDPANKNSVESIFEVQFEEGDQGQESYFSYRFLPKTNNTTLITGINSNILTYGGWNMPTEELVASYEAGDERLNATISVAVGSPDLNGMVIPEAVLEVGDPTVGDYDMYRYYTKKFLHNHGRLRNMGENWPFYRYSDALLLLAESLHLQGKSAEGLPYLNDVRERAGLDAVGALTDEVIANERRHELAFEAHRWFDLLRTGKAIEVMTAFGVSAKAQYSHLEDRTYDITTDKLLYPIPFRELTLNKELTQNNGYGGAD